LEIVTLFAAAGADVGAAADVAAGAPVGALVGTGVFVALLPPQAARIATTALLAVPVRNARRVNGARRFVVSTEASRIAMGPTIAEDFSIADRQQRLL
jgi:hypothetical protein